MLAAVEDRHAGLASAINNAVARIGGLLAIAVVPALAGIAVGGNGVDLDSGFNTAMYIAGGLGALGRCGRVVHDPQAVRCDAVTRRRHDPVRAAVVRALHATEPASVEPYRRSPDAGSIVA